MFRQKYSIVFFLFCSPLIVAHPFYKTMSEESEQTFNELKTVEKDAIDALKKTFPKVPDSFWKNLEYIEKQKQTWLSDTFSIDAPIIAIIKGEPTIKEFPSEEELKQYCSDFIEYECARQGIDFKKICLEETSKYQIGFKAPYPKTEESKMCLIDEYEEVYFINSEYPSTILINPKQFINCDKKKLELKKSIASITEAENEKRFLIKTFIKRFYDSDAIKSDKFGELMNAYKYAYRTTVNTLVPLLDPSESSIQKDLLGNDSVINKTENDGTDNADAKTFNKWLKKVLRLIRLQNDLFS